MCGIAGVLDTSGERAEELPRIADAMASAMRHRGPDDKGGWSDRDAGIALAFRRLSIVDLSAEGHQPMISSTGRYVLIFNGEVYNHRELRARLGSLGHTFRGTSDTEVFLAAVTEWGAAEALDVVNGMYAYALWDRQQRLLHLVRDRLGEKPLYYGRAGRAIVFGSELKSLRMHPDFDATVDRDSLAAFFRYKYVPSPHAIYQGVHKLRPGASLTIPADGRGLPDPVAYWRSSDIVRAGLEDPFIGSVDDATDELDALLRDAVALRMQADVPVGAFLSGGIDSSTVVSMMQSVGTRAARTFTIGSTDERYDESRDARRVATHLGTSHTDLVVTPREAMDVIPSIPEIYDEPFADSSQIPTVLVSRLAREDVTVALSGDGGDELFGGYDRYRWLPRVWEATSRMPRPIRRASSRAMVAVSPTSWQRLFARSDRVLPATARHRMIGDKVHKLARVVSAADPDEAYLRIVSHWADPDRLVLDGTEPSTSAVDRVGGWVPGAITERMMHVDLATYLPDDILAKVDRASMSVGLEARVPLLDPRVVAFAWRVPLSMKLRDGRSKWLLRSVLSRYVPPALTERPKTGFGIPIGEWLRGPLRDWAHTLLDERRIRDEGFLDPTIVGTMWRAHLSGRADHQFALWDVLTFGSWLERTARTAHPLIGA